MSEKDKVKLTESQKEAIQYNQAKNLLVSASAGSGKTFVMTSRIVNKIRNKIPLSSLFISTFTVKAAEELKNRIEKMIKTELRSKKNSREIKRLYSKALQELPLTTIGTTDAFANQLVKENYNIVNVDPKFRILTDKAEQDLIKNTIFEDLVEKHLREENSSEFEKLLKNFSNDRNIKGFQETVYKVYSFCQSTENPEGWLKHSFLNYFEKFDSFKKIPDLTMSVMQDLQEFFDCLKIEKGNLTGKTLEKAEIVLDNENNFFDFLNTGDFSTFLNLFDPELFARWKKSEDLEDVFTRVIGTKVKPGSLRDFIQKIRFTEVIEKHHFDVKRIAENLRDFILEFSENYLQQKNQMNAYEFSDILHFALDILDSKEHPEIRETYQQKFSEIMIDEYQDTNQAQEKFYKKLSNGHNLFMVGDVKQSIYGFRQADPELFQKKYQEFPQKDEKENENRLLLLQENFRSRKEILDFTNAVFKNLMPNYGKNEALKFPERTGNLLEKFNESYDLKGITEARPELLLYCEKDDGEKEINLFQQENSKPLAGEIALAAAKIIELINKGVEPRDIVLLVRSKNNNNNIKKVFEEHDIPIILDEAPINYLKSIEVQVMLDSLRAINNPLFDLPLVALLHSPLFGFTEDELARISLQEGENFWEKSRSETLQLDSKLYSKLITFRKIFSNWRKIARTSAVHELVQKIYKDTLYLEYVGALPNGEQRQANLQALMTRSLAYESNGYKGLVKFVDMIDHYLSQENDLEDVNHRLAQNAVRVQTIHKSKGLEFDYVFIMNFHSPFNQRDLRENVLLDKEGGIGLKYVSDMADEIETEFPHAMVKMESIPYLINKEKKTREIIAEEMRMLYVAFTRAKKKIYMVAEVKNEKEVSEAEAFDKNKIPTKGYLGWILALQKQLKGQMIFQGITSEIEVGKPERANLSGFKNLTSNWDDKQKIGEEFAKARKVLEFDSYNLAATKLPSTLSPSTLERHIRQFDEEKPLEKKFDFKLDKLDSKVYSTADRGTAVHHFMQKINFTEPNLFNLQKILDKLDLPEELAVSIDIPKILTLFKNHFGKLMMENAPKLKLEQPFSMLKTIRDEAGKEIEQTVIRGIIDGYFFYQDKIILFDYKTNKFSTDSEIEIIKEEYAEQQNLYAEALAKAYHGKEIEKYLILLGGPKTEPVKVVQL